MVLDRAPQAPPREALVLRAGHALQASPGKRGRVTKKCNFPIFEFYRTLLTTLPRRYLSTHATLIKAHLRQQRSCLRDVVQVPWAMHAHMFSQLMSLMCTEKMLTTGLWAASGPSGLRAAGLSCPSSEKPVLHKSHPSCLRPATA